MSIPATEYAPFYDGYIKNVTKEILEELEQQIESFPLFIQSIPESKTGFAYAEGKWTIAEVIGHIIDTERVMAYRALCFARNRIVAQPGFDENVFAANSHYNTRSLPSLAEEFVMLRKSNLYLFKSFNMQDLQGLGTANDSTISVRALLYLIAGHLSHHKNILEERYL